MFYDSEVGESNPALKGYTHACMQGYKLCEEGSCEDVNVLTCLGLYWNSGRANRITAAINSRLDITAD